MLSIIIIAFISLIGLLILHEFSHFIAAKKFGVKVPEFGIGYPPRLIGKKIGETIYSLNLLPFGAFVTIPDDKLRQKPIWQRAIILVAGIVSFWIIGAILISIILFLGAPMQITDSDTSAIDAQVQIIAIAPDSPAEKAGLEIGDIIHQLTINNEQLTIDKIEQVQHFTEEYEGEEIGLIIKRGGHILEKKLVPRVSPPSGEGAMGVGLARVATRKYPFFAAIIKGIEATVRLTGQIILAFAETFGRLIVRKPLEIQLMGPVGIMDIFVKAGGLGFVYFLQTVALISLHVAIINALPIPVADGGKLLFLAIEKIRKKPLNERIEQRINIFFFALLIALMIWVTVKDISRIF